MYFVPFGTCFYGELDEKFMRQFASIHSPVLLDAWGSENLIKICVIYFVSSSNLSQLLTDNLEDNLHPTHTKYSPNFLRYHHKKIYPIKFPFFHFPSILRLRKSSQNKTSRPGKPTLLPNNIVYHFFYGHIPYFDTHAVIPCNTHARSIYCIQFVHRNRIEKKNGEMNIADLVNNKVRLGQHTEITPAYVTFMTLLRPEMIKFSLLRVMSERFSLRKFSPVISGDVLSVG